MGKGKFSKLAVSMIILSNIVFTISILYLFYITGREPSTLIYSWFGFTTGELGILGYIKGRKEKTKIYKKEKRDYHDEI